MKIILVMVMSLDGKTTNSNKTTSEWSSEEDQSYFFSLVRKAEVIIMGRKTFLASRSVIRLSSATLRIVLTRKPELYKKFEVPGQLEFTNATPNMLIEKLRRKKMKEVLLVGGERTNGAFLSAKKIDEIWMTIEPVLFGKGRSLCAENIPLTSLRLKSINRLNPQGTLLVKYTVQKK